MDSRLLEVVPPAVAKAAMDSGIARKPIQDFDSYVAGLRHLGENCADGVCYPVLLNTPEIFSKLAARLGYPLDHFTQE